MFSQQKYTRLVFISIILLLTFFTAACGAADSNSNNTAANAGKNVTETPVAEATESPANSDEVKTITTVNGDIEVPVHPQRIVAEEYLGSLIALNVIPVGAPGLTLENYYFKEALQGVADTGIYGKPSAEQILGLTPDLIITANGDSYAQLSKIAPTIVIPFGDLKNAHEELTYFGELLGKEAEAKAWLEKYDERIAAAKAKVNAVIPADATFSIMENADNKTWVYGDNFGRGGQPVYQALGRTPPAEIKDEIMEKQWAEVSAEVLDKYAGDYIILTSNTLTVDDFKKEPIWSSLPAVKNGHLYVWTEEHSWYYDPIAVLAQTEELAEWLVNQAK
ncbi:ABC transporter substrate-binding protein [Paenibacillus lupini]|nr:ABC transporter substrate-binding protein [Paenibacillus lupini]NIK24042.1 iron complex transport system substrate-binding protein [Paenibacillus lupini]